MIRCTVLGTWLAMSGFGVKITIAADEPSEVRNVEISHPFAVDVRADLDLPYVSDGHERQRLDLYRPTQPGAPWPLIVWIHGGAWLGGSKDGCPLLAQGYVERGYAIASVGYRLSRHATFPAQIEDCKAAIRWLRAHALEHHLDAAHIGVIGPSAGGHLAALLGTAGGMQVFDVGENLEFSSAVQVVVDYFGPTDFVQMDAHAPPEATFRHDAPDSPEARLIGGPIQENGALVARASPLTYVTSGAPPFLIVHGDSDPVVPHHQSELLYGALVEARVPVHFITVCGGGHGERFPAELLDPIVATFFDHQLLGRPTTANWPEAMRYELPASVASP